MHGLRSNSSVVFPFSFRRFHSRIQLTSVIIVKKNREGWNITILPRISSAGQNLKLLTYCAKSTTHQIFLVFWIPKSIRLLKCLLKTSEQKAQRNRQLKHRHEQCVIRVDSSINLVWNLGCRGSGWKKSIFQTGFRLTFLAIYTKMSFIHAFTSTFLTLCTNYSSFVENSPLLHLFSSIIIAHDPLPPPPLPTTPGLTPMCLDIRHGQSTHSNIIICVLV